AFVSSDNSSSTDETVNTTHSVFAASSKDQASTASYADDVDADDLEEMDLKWQVEMLTMRVKRFIRKTVRKLDLNGKETVGFDRTKVECYNCHRKGHFAKECRAPRNKGNRNRDDPRRNAPVDSSTTNALVVQDGIGYQIGLESLEARIVVHEKNEAVYEEDIAFLNAKDKTGFGYDSQMNESEVVHSVFNSRESDVDDSLVNDRFKIGEGFHAVPPPYTGNYMPSRPDLSFAGLDDSVYKTKVSETITTASKTSKDNLQKPKIVRPSAPIIEDWDIDSDNDSVFRPKTYQKKLKFTKINFVKSNENVKSVNKENTHRQVEYPRKSQSPRDNRRNWNGMMTQKLGNGFEFIKKACFVCGSFNHLIKDCDFHDKKMIEKPVLNNKGRVTGQREIRPVWNNAQRVNHQNKFTHPHPKRNFVPTAVVTKSGQVPVNTAKQSSPRAATSISTARPVNIVVPKSKVNVALPKTYSYFKAHSPVKRAFNQKSVAKTYNLNEKVKIARRPTGNVIDYASKDSGSYMLKRFDYVDLQGRLKIFDSGCSRHMTGNKSFLTDYQEIDGGFVAFGGSPKGGKITGKGKIRTEKLDFEDTEYLVLSLDFKLLDESQVLLKIPRQNNMYNFDLKNVVPSGDLTCLFVKATIDESNLWHRRLGHINFKTMSKLVRGNLVRGLPSKLFENDHTCVAFSVRSINRKSYYLVVTNDFTRFSWVFFLDTKDETPEILKNFITGIENQSDYKVKTIKSDNGTEFKNRIMNELCEIKGIIREFSVARTPQQNGVAERKNRTLIEAARTMLADSKLPTSFWAEAVNTACYIQNWVLVIKPYNKTSYELFLGRKHALNFMRPIRCPVTILNTLDHLGNQTNGNAGTRANIDAGQAKMSAVPVEDPTKEDDINGLGEATNTNKLNNVSSPVNTVSSSFNIVVVVDMLVLLMRILDTDLGQNRKAKFD
ncbi:putative ribonuclease H-like domain-containing protein, partial [Tanacetum coccineum]